MTPEVPADIHPRRRWGVRTMRAFVDAGRDDVPFA